MTSEGQDANVTKQLKKAVEQWDVPRLKKGDYYSFEEHLILTLCCKKMMSSLIGCFVQSCFYQIHSS
ncbi:hypothetical protein DAI22_07g008850 [Oryza sativa Japonica Group]|nr:hypothetical protein DAI22_07g008850 [Oryza sativa Japonica Group]